MSDQKDDRALLKRYVEAGCDQAFAELVARHIHHVYSVARRETQDPHLAEELTQTAFIVLARKAKGLPPETILSGWLFQTVRYAAKNARRSAVRRHLHEQQLAHMSSHLPESDDAALWSHISAELNEIIGSLSASDRDAITLRFFEQKSHQEMAQLLRTTEPSVRKRLSRAIERLRCRFLKRGITVSSVTLAALLLARSVEAAPSSIANTITSSVATATAASGIGISLSQLVAATLRTMAAAKAKWIAGWAALVVVAIGVPSGFMIHTASPIQLGAQLSDGSTLRITHLELASEVTFTYRRPLTWWNRVALHLLPKTWSDKLVPASGAGSIGMRSENGKESLFLGVAREQIPRQSNLNLGRLVVTSDDGSSFDGVFNAGTLGYDDAQLTAWHLHAFPRRGKTLQLRFLQEDARHDWHPIAQLTITNPVSGPFSEWVPDTLPIERTAEDLRLSLIGFETVTDGMTNDDPAPELWSRFPSTRWTLHGIHPRGGRIPWGLRSVEIADATGNDWTPTEIRTWAGTETTAGGQVHVAMLGALWASEPAWRLRFELSKTNEFRSEEKFAWTGLRVPKPEEYIQVNASRRLGQTTIKCLSVSGPRTELPGAFRWMTDQTKVNLAIQTEDAQDGYRLSLVRITDDQQRVVPFHDPRPASSQTQFVFSFSPKPDARSLDFEFAYHPSRWIEFRAKPTPQATR